MSIEVVSVNISKEKGTIKTPVDQAVFDARGIVGDAHARMWHRQVSMLGQETIDAANHVVSPGFIDTQHHGRWISRVVTGVRVI